MDRAYFFKNSKEKKIILTDLIFLAIFLAGCTASKDQPSPPETKAIVYERIDTEEAGRIHPMKMWIDDTEVVVAWEENESVAALKERMASGPFTMEMAKYGGFEQVGSIGSSLPHNDVQITTAPGEIVLYSGNQMVVFYGSNSWSYTRLGKITDKTNEELVQLLGNKDVMITLAMD